MVARGSEDQSPQSQEQEIAPSTTMATFAQKTFDAVRYAAGESTLPPMPFTLQSDGSVCPLPTPARPTYPRQLYEFIFAYHGRDPRARWDTAVDLGCGTGQATLELTPFKHVIGADPSQGMLAQAREALHTRPEINTPGRFKFVQSGAEELGWLEDKSVDMVVSGACCCSGRL